jgi:hypothetical protein
LCTQAYSLKEKRKELTGYLKLGRGQAWWWMPVTPATLEAEVGGSPSETTPGKSTRSYLKKKLKTKGLRV